MMRILPLAFLAAIAASPVMAGDAVPDPARAQAQIAGPSAQADAQLAPQPRKKRALACPACSTIKDPSFAIRPATGNGQVPAAPVELPASSATEMPGAAASEPPVNFSFSGSGDGGRSSRYRGGVRVGTQF